MKVIKQKHHPDIAVKEGMMGIVTFGTLYDGQKGLTHINWIEKENIPALIEALREFCA